LFVDFNYYKYKQFTPIILFFYELCGLIGYDWAKALIGFGDHLPRLKSRGYEKDIS
jgi:hypothetical protein